MFQDHLESVEEDKASRADRYLQGRLQAWRSRWVIGLRSVSKERVERRSAVLAAYEVEGAEAVGEEAKWADNQWAVFEHLLSVDATPAPTGLCETVGAHDSLPQLNPGHQPAVLM